MKGVSKAFCPAGVSSFFEMCDRTPDGLAVGNLERIGARGGGFVIKKGVETTATVAEEKRNSVTVSINGMLSPEAKTSRYVAEALLARTKKNYQIAISHKSEVPIGAGFGSSAAGALGAALALSNALELKLTYNELGKIAHIAEIKCKTGLGTVGPIMLGGCILTVEPGAPGIGIIDRLPLSPGHIIVAGTFEQVPTKKLLLTSPGKREKINQSGNNALKAILDEPSIENFLVQCQEFAERAGFMTQRTRALVKVAERAGAIGAAQNMVGEAVHALTRQKNVGKIEEAFKRILPEEKVITAGIDFQGARLL